MQTLDIIDLIEKNPITKLSNTYNNKLLQKIKENFNEEEQKIFITSFYCYLNYHPKNDFIIDLDNVWRWLDFSQKIKIKQLLEKNFIENIDYKKLLYHEVKQDNKHGGHNKETFLLSIRTFKLLCIKANTKKAQDIHQYFIKLEEILQEVIEEESNDLKLQLDKKNIEINEIEIIKTNEIKKFEEKLKNVEELKNHEILLNKFGNYGSIIYIIKVKKFEDGTYVIKIGESRIGLLNRYNEHKLNYECCIILDCFPVNRSKDFESFLHNYNIIKNNRCNYLKSHENEKELFLIGKELTYFEILNIINNNIKYFNEISYMEVEKLNLEIEKLNSIKNIFSNNEYLDNISNNFQKILDELSELKKSNKELLDKLNSNQTKTTTNFNEPLPTLGPRLQKINPETLQIIKVYESVSECMKESINLKRPSINKAVLNNTIYQGYRWSFVDRTLDPSILHHIQETVPLQKNQNNGYIAKLNKDKTKIINVYLDRKTASQENGYISSSALDNPVKNGTLKDGFYYVLYDKCNEVLKNNFENRNNNYAPLLYKNGVGQFDIHQKLIREFVCKYDCIRILRISDKTLSKALDHNKMYNNHYYKYIGSKLKCF